VKTAFDQKSPRDFQLDVAEALILGLDTTVVAGTGSGKTLPWAMPLLLDENKERTCLVVLPLKVLQVDHVSHWEVRRGFAVAVFVVVDLELRRLEKELEDPVDKPRLHP